MKDPKQYEALHEAISSYNDEYNCTMKYWGELLGFAYKNAGAQFAGRLNPNSDKAFNSTQLNIITEELDDRNRRLYFDRYLRQWRLVTAPLGGLEISGTIEVMRLAPDVTTHQQADRAILAAGELFRTIKDALEDNILERNEVDAIIKAANEARVRMRCIEECAIATKKAEEEGL